jgi:hypothetical protein
MDLAGFHTRVKRALARGDQLDSSIPDWVEEAVQQMESNYDFQYMRRWVDIPVSYTAPVPYLITLYNTPLKEVSLLRFTHPNDGRFREIKGPKNPQDRDTRQVGFPSSFWLDGVSNAVLDAIPGEDFTIEGHVKAFTVWQSGQPTFQHFLIDRYRSLLLSETVLLANMELRDPKLTAIYESLNARAWTTTKMAEEAFQYGGETGAEMVYSPPFDEFDDDFNKNIG